MKINGIEVEDANEGLVVKITKQDVRRGELKNSSACAAANAICRQHHADEARVHFARAYVRKGKKWLRFSVPPALRRIHPLAATAVGPPGSANSKTLRQPQEEGAPAGRRQSHEAPISRRYRRSCPHDGRLGIGNAGVTAPTVRQSPHYP